MQENEHDKITDYMEKFEEYINDVSDIGAFLEYIRKWSDSYRTAYGCAPTSKSCKVMLTVEMMLMGVVMKLPIEFQERAKSIIPKHDQWGNHN